MAEDPSTALQTPEERYGIGVEAVDVDIESEETVDDEETSHNQTNDNPPEYNTVLAEEERQPVAVNKIDGEGSSTPPPLSYEAVMAENSNHQEPSSTILTTEAPPSYLQLFGKDEIDGFRRLRLRLRGRGGGGEGEEGNRQLRFQNLLPTDRKSAYRCGTVLVLLIMLAITGLTMIVIGFANYKQCATHEIPLYLIVAGLFFLVEVVLHSTLWIAQKLSNDETIYRLIRRFDCIALFLIVWLVVGSAWIFKAGRDNSCGRDYIDYVMPGNSSRSPEEEEVGGPPMRGSATEDCRDCSSGVYVFTVFLILFQYIMVLVLGICCCTSSVRSRRYH